MEVQLFLVAVHCTQGLHYHHQQLKCCSYSDSDLVKYQWNGEHALRQLTAIASKIEVIQLC